MDSISIPDNPDKTVCFSGPRPFKLPGKGSPLDSTVQKITGELKHQIEAAIQRGMLYYISGLMAGIDIIAGEEVLRLKSRYPDIKLILVSPFSKNYFATKHWSPDWITRAKELCSHRDYGVSLHEKECRGAYYERDRFIVEHSKELICYYNGQGGGTKYTVDCAKKAGLVIYNIFDTL